MSAREVLRHRFEFLVGLRARSDARTARTSSDFLRAKLSRVSTNDITVISSARASIRKRQTSLKEPFSFADNELPPIKQTAASGTSGRRRRKCDCRSLEGEIHAGARHTEVVVRTVNEVPAEITDPADVRREADFECRHQTWPIAFDLGISCDRVYRVNGPRLRSDAQWLHNDVRFWPPPKMPPPPPKM